MTLIEASIEPYAALLRLKLSSSITLTSANLSALLLYSSNASFPLGPANATVVTANISSDTHYIQLNNQIEDALGVLIIVYGWEPMSIWVDSSFLDSSPISTMLPLAILCELLAILL